MIKYVMVKIYLITNCYGNPNMIYIGKTKNSREKAHKRTFGNQISYDYIDRAESLNKKDWEPLESYWIEQFRQWGFHVLNKNKGGGGCNSHKPESILKIKTAMKNREYLPEWGEQVSLATKGKIKNHPKDRGLNISKAKKGKSNPKLSKTRTGKPHPKQGRIIIQKDIFNNIIKEWESSKLAGNELNIHPDLIRAAARGIQKTAGGYIWEYKNIKYVI